MVMVMVMIMVMIMVMVMMMVMVLVIALMVLTMFRYDPTQQEEWQRFRNQTMGDSAMLTQHSKVCSEEASRMRSNSDAFRIMST